MRKVVTIIIGLVLACSAYGQTKVNKRIMLESLNNKLSTGTVDSLVVLPSDAVAIFSGTDTLFAHTPDAYTDDPYDLFPEIHAFAGDTSNYPVPDKIGDLFIDTSASKVYVSVSTSRGGWVILNLILPLFIFVRRRRRK